MEDELLGGTTTAKAGMRMLLAWVGLRVRKGGRKGRARVVMMEKGGKATNDEKDHQQYSRFCFNALRDVPSLTPSLARWVILGFLQDKTYKTVYTYLLSLRQSLSSLQPSLPSSPSSTPASLQAVLLQPATQTAVLRYYREMRERRREGKTWDTANTRTAFNHFLALLKLTIKKEGGEEGGEELVVVRGARKGWKGWREEEEEEEEEEGEEEEEEEGSVFRRRLEGVTLLAPALKEKVRNLFRYVETKEGGREGGREGDS